MKQSSTEEEFTCSQQDILSTIVKFLSAICIFHENWIHFENNN